MRAILLLLPIVMASCTGISEEARRTRIAAKAMMGKAVAQEWELAQWYDPYNGGYTVVSDSAYPSYLILFADGGFIQSKGPNYSDGSWLVNESNDKMALVYHIQNGTRIQEASRDTVYRYQMLQNSADTLKLGIQGRHGIVEYTYRPARKSILPTPSQP